MMPSLPPEEFSWPGLPPEVSRRAMAERHFAAGNAHSAAGRSAEARAEFQAALALCPDLAEAGFNLGIEWERSEALEEARDAYQQAAAARPHLPEVHFALGNVCFKTRRWPEAVAAYRTALALREDFVPAWLNLGNALRMLNQLAAAQECYERVAVLRPDSADAPVNLANVCRAQNRLPEAQAAAERALALAPESPEAHLNLAMTLLVAGDLRAGWPHAEYRHAWKLGGAGRKFPQPRWDGTASLAGRRILLHGEQGFGDTLQFVRYVPLIAQRGAIVHVEVQPALRSLLAASLPEAASVRAFGEPLPEFDLHCPLPSLPGAFGTSLDTIPARVPYVQVPPEVRNRWQGYRPDAPGPRIGVAWAGNPTHPNDGNRSLTLAEFQSALAGLPPITFISLKKERTSDEAALLARSPGWQDPAVRLEDFSETAALIAQLDLVIAVDTSVAHLAGALGKPLWVLLPFSPDWRWLLGRKDSPWYPTARLFRQPRTGDWDSVLREVRRELADRWLRPLPG